MEEAIQDGQEIGKCCREKELTTFPTTHLLLVFVHRREGDIPALKHTGTDVMQGPTPQSPGTHPQPRHTYSQLLRYKKKTGNKPQHSNLPRLGSKRHNMRKAYSLPPPKAVKQRTKRRKVLCMCMRSEIFYPSQAE
jgi:hypothetical protein